MKDDGFDLPEPPGFEDTPKKERPRLTASHAKTLVFLLISAALLAGLCQFGVNLEKNDPNFIGKLWNELTGNSPRKVFTRMSNHLRRGNLEAALKESDRLVELRPNNPDPRRWRAAILSEMGRYEDSVSEYTRLLEMDDTQATAYNNRAYNRALARIDLQEALQDVEKALEIEGGNPAFLDTRGYLYYLLGRHEEALLDLNRALQQFHFQEEFGEILFHRALVYDQLGIKGLAKRDRAEARNLGFEFQWEDRPLPVQKSRRDSRLRLSEPQQI